MVRYISIFFGGGLIVFGLAEFRAGAIPWMMLLTFMAAARAFAIGASPTNRSSTSTLAGSYLVLALGLFTLWLTSLAAGTIPHWQIWWNFGFGCAFLFTGLKVIHSESSNIGTSGDSRISPSMGKAATIRHMG
jgi:hypothetical protein